jgi:signal transduction histidine kinase/CheY-like chemotaxis protein
MDLHEQLAQERRARLAAERLLDQRQAELHIANRDLSRHARVLSEEIIVRREEVAEVRDDLQKAAQAVEIAERRLWTSLQTIGDGFAVFDAASKLVAANPAWLAPFDGLEVVRPGVPYAEVLEILTDEGIVDIGTERPSLWRDRMLHRWTQERIEPVVIRLWNGRFVRLADKRGAGGDIASMAQDITATMRNEARLKAAFHKAEAAHRAKSNFLANMSHELRTPMNGVVGMAEILAESALDDDQRNLVQTIRQSGEALLVIINDILDLSKMDENRLKLVPSPFDMERTIIEVLQLIQPLAEEKGLDLTIDYDMFAPTQFLGDKGRIRQILTNLIGNAVKFTPAGHVAVRVVGMPDEDGLHMTLHVTVEDTGIGIPAGMTTHIFGEFNQVEEERNRKYEGTGLGLSITKRLVEMMDGEIWVDSEVDVGSAFGFRLTLPVVEPVDLPTCLQPLRESRVAVVDGNRTSAGILKNQIAALGLNPVVFETGAACIDGLTPDIVAAFLGSTLPDMPGTELAETLTGLLPRLKCFIVARQGEYISGPMIAAVLHKPLLRQSICSALDLVQPEDAARPPVALRQMRVLAAEDNKTNQLVLGKMLAGLDIDLRFANDGRQALDLYTSFRPDLVFMDISMPGMDGKQSTREIRRFEGANGLARTPVVALTAHAMAGDAGEILEAGLDVHLTKPLRKDQLLAQLDRAHPGECLPLRRATPVAPAEPAAGATG